jgi:hypothetical protein
VLPTRGGGIVAQNWHEERNRIVELLEAIESGQVTHLDQEELGQLQTPIRKISLCYQHHSV